VSGSDRTLEGTVAGGGPWVPLTGIGALGAVLLVGGGAGALVVGEVFGGGLSGGGSCPE
jgi:hypothetical protein